MITYTDRARKALEDFHRLSGLAIPYAIIVGGSQITELQEDCRRGELRQQTLGPKKLFDLPLYTSRHMTGPVVVDHNAFFALVTLLHPS